MSSYSIRFAENAFSLLGPGTLAFEADGVRVRGRRRRSFTPSQDFEVLFPRAHVVNVVRNGPRIRFEVPAAMDSPDVTLRKRIPFVCFDAESEEAAAEIQAGLPAELSEGFAQAVSDFRAFESQLAAVTPRAFVTQAIVAINVIIFLAMMVDGAGLFASNPETHLRWGSNFGPMTTDGQWWRLFTSMFLHFGAIHLIFNMWALYDTGRVVERIYGNGVFLVLYLVAGVAGSITSLLVHAQVNSAGASGAIFGVFGAMLAFMLARRGEVPATIMRAHRGSTMAFIGYSLVFGFIHPGIDNAAHIGGLTAGLLLGLGVARPLDPQLRARRTGQLAGAMAAALVVLALTAVPLGKVAARFSADKEWIAAWELFTRDRDIVNRALGKIREDRNMTDEEAARALEREVIPLSRINQQRLAAVRLPGDSRFAEEQRATLKISAAYLDGYESFANALRAQDPEALKRAQAKLAAASALVRARNARNTQGR